MRHVASTTVDTIYRVFRSYPHWMKIPSNGIYVNVCDGTPHTHDLHDAHMRKCATDQTRILPPLPHSRCRSLAGGPTCPHATHDLVRSRRPHALSSGRIRIPPADMRPAASRPKQRSTARAAPMCRRGPLKSRVRRVVSRRPAQDIVFSTFSRTCTICANSGRLAGSADQQAIISSRTSDGHALPHLSIGQRLVPSHTSLRKTSGSIQAKGFWKASIW
mmetsp:Transcript_13384/g.44291  ORF Transcript_13384/g.44291 Transcript_13384/m.44291 type:complete len:218 (-) Transcript_13384:222-875(-)